MHIKGLTIKQLNRRVDIVTVVVDVGRYMDGAVHHVDRYTVEVWVGDQLKLAHVQLLGVRIRPLLTYTVTQADDGCFWFHETYE